MITARLAMIIMRCTYNFRPMLLVKGERLVAPSEAADSNGRGGWNTYIEKQSPTRQPTSGASISDYTVPFSGSIFDGNLSISGHHEQRRFPLSRPDP